MSRFRAPAVRRSQGYAWGFVDQALSSATSFALFLVAGRTVGAHGLGVVTIGMAGYLLALGFQRSLLTTPLVSACAALEPAERAVGIRRALALDLPAVAAAGLALTCAGLIVPGDAGRGLLVLAPWLPPALLQDFWRAVLFQEGRARAAAMNDALWLVLLLAAAPLCWVVPSVWTVAACWGVGAIGAAVLGLVQLRLHVAAPGGAFRWWQRRLWPFGRWLGLEGVVYAATTMATVFVLNSVVGADSLGGLRAAQSLFAPLTLIMPAIALPGLPAMARALAGPASAASRLAVTLSAAVAGLACIYGGVMLLLGGRLIPALFGPSFAEFSSLARPIGVWQVVLGMSAGFAILLTAQERGRDLFAVRVTSAAATMGCVTVLAWTGGVTGAAWGYAVGAALATALTVFLALRVAAPVARARLV